MTLELLPFLLETASKAVVYIALLLALGTSSVRLLMLPRLDDSPAGALKACEGRLSHLALLSGILLASGLAVRLVAHTAAAFGVAGAASYENLRVIGLESRWGQGWALQMLAGVVALSGAVLIRAQRHTGWVAFSSAIVACALATPLLGHAAGDRSRMAYHSIHILGAGFWLGSLGAILIVGHARAALLRRFAPVALPAAAFLLASGTAMTLTYVGSVQELWTSGYGRTLAIKLVLASGVAACGYSNWRYWRRPDQDKPRRFEAIEAALALAIVLMTALLTELEHS